jgi:signal transduction histidine kinase
VYTRWIVTPVNQLVSGIDKFATGDLKYRIPMLGTDEVSMLAGRFNEMAEKLTQFQEKLKRTERLETLSKMASVLSHEIKNPLNAMVVNMQVMEREFNRSEPKISKLRHYLGVVAGEIQRVDDLVNNFLMVARPPKLDRRPENMDKVLDEIIISQQAEALQSGVRIKRRYQGADVSLLVDVTKIKQVFLNILLNAIQAMPGGGNLTIELEVIRSEIKGIYKTWIVTRFKDDGKGMKKEHIANIFDFYYSTKPGGSGLGLSIAQQIVEEHGGRIEVESEEGKGSVFSVFLPKS